MIRRPPRSTLDRSSAASDVYKRQGVKKAAAKVEKAVSPKKPAARKSPTPGMQLDKGIASVKRATKKAENAVRETVKPARKSAKKKAVKRAAAK